ncbi:hypothetical protein L083_5064 [Actinoplanes sp. N902-109]|nr:hypothetical protein L083_5064 [Actinoplanes sp. N902-109]
MRASGRPGVHRRGQGNLRGAGHPVAARRAHRADDVLRGGRVLGSDPARPDATVMREFDDMTSASSR